MGAPVLLRADYAADDLRRLAKASRDAGQARRLLALAAIYDGASRTAAARAESAFSTRRPSSFADAGSWIEARRSSRTTSGGTSATTR